jgi:hypothetical protein
MQNALTPTAMAEASRVHLKDLEELLGESGLAVRTADIRVERRQAQFRSGLPIGLPALHLVAAIAIIAA